GQATEGAGEDLRAGLVRRWPAEDGPRDGQGRRRLPALRPVRRALPDRRVGHAEVPAADHAGRRAVPRSQEAAAAGGGDGQVKRLELVNDFVIKFANVNGSGSASANELFAKAILRMGLPESAFRDGVHVIGMPLTAICNATYEDARQRQLFKNIMYVGALSMLLGISADVVEKLFAEQYRGKERLLDSNIRAFTAGREFARDHLDPIGLAVKRADKVGEHIFIDGNAAAALGCMYGGATVCAWYPITPSSSLAEAFQKYCGKYRVDAATGQNNFAIVQAEDEIASIGMVVGAGWNGARAFTATSGPGVSLMTEFIGLAYFAEIPVTIIDVQRGGPSTGMPTRTQQADLLS